MREKSWGEKKMKLVDVHVAFLLKIRANNFYRNEQKK